MGVFGKEEEYIDYTLLKKKGLLKAKEEQAHKNIKTEGGFIDFTSMRNESSSNNAPSSPAASTTSAFSNFSFLGEMTSSAGNGQENPSSPAGFDSVFSGTPIPTLENTDGKEINALKIKVDDLDYKIDRFIERIDKLEEKLARFG